MRGSVSGDTAWELSCRLLEQSVETKTIGTRDIAQLILYLLERELPPAMSESLFAGMLEELNSRGKTIQTEGDEAAAKSRWIKQQIHGELDCMRESWLAKSEEAPVDLDVDYEMLEGEQQSLRQETERAASEVLAEMENSNLGEAAVHIPEAYWDACEDECWFDCDESGRGSVVDETNHDIAGIPETYWDDCADAAWSDCPGLPDTYWDECADEASSDCADKQPQDDIPAIPPVEAPVGKPVVDPPEFDERIRDTDKEPFWIPGAFPTIFQNESGDPHNYYDKEPDLVTWGPHILRSKGWAAQAHMTFMYWWMNMTQRIKALSAKKWFIRDNPHATGYTAQDLKNMGVKGLSKQMTGYTADIPGTKGSKARLRKIILAMVKQIEIETRRDAHMGDVPSLFGTLTSQRYQWDGIISIIAQVEGIADYTTLSKSKRRALVNKYPLFVAFYCAVRLELTLKCIVVPYYGASNYVGVFEWSPTGAMVHLHYILWRPGAPRFDLRAEQLERDAATLRKAGLAASDVTHCRIHDVIDFFAQYVSEFNPNKDNQGKEVVGHVAERVNKDDDHPAAVPIKQMLEILQPSRTQPPEKVLLGVLSSLHFPFLPSSLHRPLHLALPTSSARVLPIVLPVVLTGCLSHWLPVLAFPSVVHPFLRRTEERHNYYNHSVRMENLHDFHYPDPLGPPNPSQPCAKLLRGTQNIWYCSNGYPRDLVLDPAEQSVSQDALRSDLWRANLRRNCPVMNSHIPVTGLGLQSNSDAQPVLTRHQAEMYCCKYCAKHTKRLGTRCALFDILDDMDARDTHAKEQYGDAFTESKLGAKMHKVFMAEIGEEMSQSEVAHHANRCSLHHFFSFLSSGYLVLVRRMNAKWSGKPVLTHMVGSPCDVAGRG